MDALMPRAQEAQSGHFDRTPTGTARFNVDIEHPLEPLCPCHGCPVFGGCLIR